MKINLAIIFGGVSGEHEVSKITAFSVLNNIKFEKFNIQPFYIDLDGVWHTSEHIFESKSTAFENIDSLIEVLTIKNPNLFELKESRDVDKAMDDVVSALVNLGYKKEDVLKIIPDLKNKHFDSLEDYIKEGLRVLREKL